MVIDAAIVAISTYTSYSPDQNLQCQEKKVGDKTFVLFASSF